MRIDTRHVQDALVIDMVGRLDSHSAGEVGDRIAALAMGPEKRLVVNLSAVPYVSSAGLRVLLRGAKLAQAHGGALKLCAAVEMVDGVLDTAGFDSLLVRYPTESDALAAFAKG